MTSAWPGVHLHFLLCIVGQQTVTMLHRACVTEGLSSCDFKLVKSHDVYIQKTHGFQWEEVSLTGTESCQFYLGDEIILDPFQVLLKSLTPSVSPLKIEKPAVCWMGQKKLFVEQHVLPPRSWIAIVETHNKKGKLIQIAAQLCGPGICFSILHLPMRTKDQLCTWALNFFFFLLVSWAGPIQLFKGMQMDDSST